MFIDGLPKTSDPLIMFIDNGQLPFANDHWHFDSDHWLLSILIFIFQWSLDFVTILLRSLTFWQWLFTFDSARWLLPMAIDLLTMLIEFCLYSLTFYIGYWSFDYDHLLWSLIKDISTVSLILVNADCLFSMISYIFIVYLPCADNHWYFLMFIDFRQWSLTFYQILLNLLRWISTLVTAPKLLSTIILFSQLSLILRQWSFACPQ